MFRIHSIKTIDDQDLTKIISITSLSDKSILFQVFEKSSDEDNLNEIGPRIKLVSRRNIKASSDIQKEAFKIPNVLKPKIEKNVEKNELGYQIGKIRINKPDFSKLALKKRKVIITRNSKKVHYLKAN